MKKPGLGKLLLHGDDRASQGGRRPHLRAATCPLAVSGDALYGVTRIETDDPLAFDRRFRYGQDTRQGERGPDRPDPAGPGARDGGGGPLDGAPIVVLTENAKAAGGQPILRLTWRRREREGASPNTCRTSGGQAVFSRRGQPGLPGPTIRRRTWP